MDDQAPRPQAPALSWDEIPEEPTSLVDERIVADTYYNDEVEKVFLDNIASYKQGAIDPSLPAAEYKIRGMANQEIANTLLTIWEKVKDAARLVDTTQRNTGGK